MRGLDIKPKSLLLQILSQTHSFRLKRATTTPCTTLGGEGGGFLFSPENLPNKNINYSGQHKFCGQQKYFKRQFGGKFEALASDLIFYKMKGKLI
jgi:hypothetical protein